MTPSCILIPCLDCPELSRRAIISAASQLGVEPLNLLVIDQGSTPENFAALEELYALIPTLRLWRHDPPLPSLAATWNRGLDYAWAIGCKDALVVNNDVELSLTYYQQLRTRMKQDVLHFLSGVGVHPGQTVGLPAGQELTEPFQLHPDFSAFVITRLCHQKYRFDEYFTPAYLEDCDYHRRMLLGDDGRKIGKINIPFLHYASGTLKAMSEAQRQQWGDRIEKGSRAYYKQKWGAGGLNQETKVEPFGADVDYPVTMDTLRGIAERGLLMQLHLTTDTLEQANAAFERTLYGKAGSTESA